ncbi:hypothetical protein BDW74DRAFT_180459 [Aspergillus multicolor]|uniref:uncharacterized protein n=1 Tax=Aspergillus multicolor TaxID=41759 RepID=UPI003CCDCDD3
MSRNMPTSGSGSGSGSYSPVVTIIERQPRPILERRPRLKSDPNPCLVQVWPKDPQPGNPEHWSTWRRWKDVFTGKGPDIYVERRTRTTRRYSYSYPSSQRHDGERDHGPYASEYVRKKVRFDFDERSPSPSGFRTRHRRGPSGGGGGGQAQEYEYAVPSTGWSLWHKDHLKWCKIPNCDVCRQIQVQDRKNDALFWARRPSDDRYDYRTRTYGPPDLGTWSGKAFCDDPSHGVPRQYWDKDRRALPENHYHDMVHGAHEDRKPRRRVDRYELFRD